MRFRNTAAALALIAVPFASAVAEDDDLLRNLISTGATTASSYVTSGDHDNKLVGPVRDDASSFIASDGAIRGPYLEAELQRLRNENPAMQGRSDQELASAILASSAGAH